MSLLRSRSVCTTPGTCAGCHSFTSPRSVLLTARNSQPLSITRLVGCAASRRWLQTMQVMTHKAETTKSCLQTKTTKCESFPFISCPCLQLRTPAVNDEFQPEGRERDVFDGGKPAHANGANDLPSTPDRNPASPTDKLAVSIKCDVKAFLWMADFLADLFGGFAFASRGPRFVGGDANGRKRRSVHASECYEFAVRVGYCNDCGLLLLERFLHDDVDDPLRLLVVDCKSALHLLS